MFNVESYYQLIIVRGTSTWVCGHFTWRFR